MADKYSIKESTLKGLADAVRSINGTTDTYTPGELIQKVATILEDGLYILVDENGNELPATFVEEEVVLTATENDIRLGTTAVTEDGIIEGTKDIPTYYVSEGYKVITNKSKFVLPMNNYDYTKLQAIFCPYNENMASSVAAEKVAIENNVYLVNSTTVENPIIKDHDNRRVDFGFTNESGSNYLIRYFSYKEIY